VKSAEIRENMCSVGTEHREMREMGKAGHTFPKAK
jgi:hypothetical protein